MPPGRRDIAESVGKNGRNRPQDVDVVQEMLNMTPPQEGGPQKPLKVDGLVGPKTIGAIQQFQLHRFGFRGADGRVDPGHQTHTWLRVFEGAHGGRQWRIAVAELTPGHRGVSDSYYVLIGKGSSFYSFGKRPEPNPAFIASHLTFTNDVSKFRTFQTQLNRGPRSFETKACREQIFPRPQDASKSLVTLSMGFPRADVASQTDFIDIGFVHQWIDPTNKPAAFRSSRGSFHLLKAVF